VDEEGVSMTEHYARRKNGEELVSRRTTRPSTVLAPTYGVHLLPGAVAMAIWGGPSRGSNDEGRPAAEVGRQEVDQRELAKCKVLFLDGGKQEKPPDGRAGGRGNLGVD
jgi:hypothetical protein